MDFNNLFTNIEKLHVLVVGDLMVDRYFMGKVSRISPEAPVPVVEWISEDNRLGGAANVALNVTSLGANVYLCGVVGQDPDSECFFSLMEESALSAELVIQTARRVTSIKTRVIADDQHLLRLDRESKDDLDKKEEDLLMGRVSGFLQNKVVDVIILQDYNKGVLTPNVIEFIIKTAKLKNIPITVDPKLNNFWAYKGVNLFKPNLKEVRDVLPFPVAPTKDSLKEAAAYIKNELQNDFLLITLSEDGLFASSQNISSIFPTTKRKVADVCGAGDGVIAIVSLALSLGLSLEEMALLANLVGGQIVESVGVVPVNKEVLVEELIKGQSKKVL